MKKTTIIFLSLALVLSLSACLKKKAESPEAGGGNKPLDRGLTQKNSLFAWLQGSQGTECAVEGPSGRMTVQARGGKVRISGIPYTPLAGSGQAEAKNGIHLTDGDWIYMWSGQEGMKMNIKQMEEISAELAGEEPPAEQKTWQEMASEWDREGVGYNCEDKRLPDSLFTPPDDVEFSDLTEFMEGMAEMSQQMEAQMEAGNFDMDALQDQMEEMQEQYQ